MLNMQNVKDIKIPEGDVRTIHDKDNRLIWGRLAYDTKYAGDTYQQTYSGQNLFDMSVDNRVSWSDALTEDENGWITATGYNGFYNFWTKPNMNLVPGATYYYVLEVKEVYAANASDHIMICNGTATATASKPQFVDDADLKYTDLQAGGIYVGSITASSDFSNVNNMLRSWCRPYNASSKLVFRLTIMSSQPSPSTFVYEPYVGGIPAPNPDYPQAVQVVTGEQTVTIGDGVNSEDFTISLGSLELRKIGDYQDYIYQSNGDWYVHKDTGKAVFDGTESWSGGTSTGSPTYLYAYTAALDSSSLYSATQAFCSHFTIWPNQLATGTSVSYPCMSVVTPSAATYAHIRLMIPLTIAANITGLKTWLGSHNTSLYYVLATATDTKITDATLIEQLNAVHEWLTRYGYNATVSGNLPIIINQTNL